MKEIGEECEGLYVLLNQTTGKLRVLTLSAQGVVFVSDADINLWRKRLGHVSSTAFTNMLPMKNHNTIDIVKQCDMCPCAKQCRLPFLTSTSNSVDNFDLVHMDVWGPIRFQLLMETNNF